jgi:hypothetical protein
MDAQEQINCRYSSFVLCARYDYGRHVLEVDFKDQRGHKRSTYAYLEFSSDEWEQFRFAKFRGLHFAHRVRGRFKTVKIWTETESNRVS